MQLVAYGAQDVYLTGNPQITFFKVVYRRHTNFAMESVEQTFNGQADFGKKVTCTISRNGDLIHRTYLRVQLPDITVQQGQAFRWVNYVGQALISSVELEIGGMRIDKHYGDWMHIWNELSQTAGKQLGYANMVGNIPQFVNPTEVPAAASGIANDSVVISGKTNILYVPLEFWFCRNPGLALPLIALQYHEVKINLELNTFANCSWSGAVPTAASIAGTEVPAYAMPISPTPQLASCSLYVDFIYLDTDERRRFAQVAHEYLIEQLQYTGAESTSSTNNKIKLNFNHPTKEIVWVVQPDANVLIGPNGPSYGPQWYNYTDAVDNTLTRYQPSTWTSRVQRSLYSSNASTMSNSAFSDRDNFAIDGGRAAGGANATYTLANFEGGENPVQSAILQLNGHDRFSIRDGRYFNLVQPYQHHENVPSKGINVYSFGLKPEEHQPSGTCNFSRIDTATLNITLTANTVSKTTIINGSSVLTSGLTSQIRVYAVNYNVLRIMSGMGGMAYSD